VQGWTTIHIVWPFVAYDFPKKTWNALFVSLSAVCFQPACAGITVIALDLYSSLGNSWPESFFQYLKLWRSSLT